jgi:ribonucleoside-diphosphate reductase beta chain
MIQVFNKNNVDFTKQYMFFGEQPNVSRFDIPRYDIYTKLYEKQWGFFWQPSEVDLSKDNRDFKTLPENEQHIFVKNLLFQSLLDSVQSRAPALALIPHVSLPELESMIELWTAFESLHNFSYQWIVKGVFNDSTEILDGIVLDPHILQRADAVAKYYDEFLEYSSWYRVLGRGKHTIISEVDGETTTKVFDLNERELKRRLLLCMASINVLEGVRFYASFACSFAFAERGLMEGNAKVISLIARDENLHLALTQNILKKWASGEDDPVMAELWQENQEVITQMYIDCVAQEREWSAYLFQYGPMLGLTEDILNEYSSYIAGKRMRAIGLKHNFPSKNPLGWTDKYLNGADNQVAPQEAEISNYVVGAVEHDVTEDTFASLDFD